MGLVYRVHHLEWQIDLAIKIPLGSHVADASSTERFIREAQTWVDLGLHPNIVQCYYVRELHGMPCIFMHYMRGGSLKDWIKQGKVKQGDWKTILNLMIQACDGLSCAHEKGVVHRDIKPANMMMSEDGILCITDFGLVKLTGVQDIEAKFKSNVQHESATSLTIAGGLMGTPEYGAPEQWVNAGKVNASVDIYALGIVIFELCCGRRPFDEADSHREPAHVLIGRHLSSPVPDINLIQKDVPALLCSIINQCLQKDFNDRYPSASILREELRNAYQLIIGHPYPNNQIESIKLRSSSLNNKAISLWDLKQRKEALSTLKHAFKLDSQHLETVKNLNIIEWQESCISDIKCLKRLDSLKNIYQKNHLYWQYLGEFQTSRGSLEQAIQSFENAIQLNPTPEYTDQLKKLETCLTTDEYHPRHLTTIESHTKQVNCLLVDQQANSFFSGSTDEELKHWDMNTTNLIQVFRDELRNWEISSMAITSDGLYLITGHRYIQDPSWGRPIKFPFIKKWDIKTAECILRINEFPDVDVDDVLISVDDRFIIAITSSGIVKFDIEAGTFIHGFKNEDNKYFKPITAQIHPVDNTIYSIKSVGYNQKYCLRIHDISSGNLLRTITIKLSHHICVMHFIDNRKSLMLGTEEDSLVIINLTTERLTLLPNDDTSHNENSAKVNCIRSSPDDRLIFTAGGWLGTVNDYKRQRRLAQDVDQASSYLRVFQSDTGRCIRTFQEHDLDVTALAIFNHGKRAITGSHNGKIRVYNLEFPATFTLPTLSISKISTYTTLIDHESSFINLKQQAINYIAGNDQKNGLIALKEARCISGFERDKDLLELWNHLAKTAIRSKLKTAWLVQHDTN